MATARPSIDIPNNTRTSEVRKVDDIVERTKEFFRTRRMSLDTTRRTRNTPISTIDMWFKPIIPNIRQQPVHVTVTIPTGVRRDITVRIDDVSKLFRDKSYQEQRLYEWLNGSPYPMGGRRKTRRHKRTNRPS